MQNCQSTPLEDLSSASQDPLRIYLFLTSKVPETLISDKAANFHTLEKRSTGLRTLHKQTEHIHDVAFDGVHHNNQMESFNGNTLRHREKVVRELKREDSSIISGLRICHNFVRPRPGLPEEQTPAETVGITVESENRILTIIQDAAEAKKSEA